MGRRKLRGQRQKESLDVGEEKTLEDGRSSGFSVLNIHTSSYLLGVVELVFRWIIAIS